MLVPRGLTKSHAVPPFGCLLSLQVSRYQTWSEEALKKARSTAAVLYVSDYGFSDRLSQVRTERGRGGGWHSGPAGLSPAPHALFDRCAL